MRNSEGRGSFFAEKRFVPDVRGADLPAPHQRAMHSFWVAQCEGGKLPPASAIDPLVMPRKALPFIGMMAPTGDGDFMVRLVGTGIRDAVGIDFTGMLTSRIPGAANAHKRFQWCHEEGRTYMMTGPVTWGSLDLRSYSVVALPFTDGRAVSRIILVFDFSLDICG